MNTKLRGYDDGWTVKQLSPYSVSPLNGLIRVGFHSGLFVPIRG
jgi:hypothetical protein